MVRWIQRRMADQAGAATAEYVIVTMATAAQEKRTRQKLFQGRIG